MHFKEFKSTRDACIKHAHKERTLASGDFVPRPTSSFRPRNGALDPTSIPRPRAPNCEYLPPPLHPMSLCSSGRTLLLLILSQWASEAYHIHMCVVLLSVVAMTLMWMYIIDIISLHLLSSVIRTCWLWGGKITSRKSLASGWHWQLVSRLCSRSLMRETDNTPVT